MEESGEALVCLEIPTAVVGGRPVWMLQLRLTSELLGDAECLDRSQARDTLSPVGVFGLAHRGPIPGDEVANPVSNHPFIVTRRFAGPQQWFAFPIR